MYLVIVVNSPHSVFYIFEPQSVIFRCQIQIHHIDHEGGLLHEVVYVGGICRSSCQNHRLARCRRRQTHSRKRPVDDDEVDVVFLHRALPASQTEVRRWSRQQNLAFCQRLSSNYPAKRGVLVTHLDKLRNQPSLQIVFLACPKICAFLQGYLRLCGAGHLIRRLAVYPYGTQCNTHSIERQAC